jgi:hypothetical protein
MFSLETHPFLLCFYGNSGFKSVGTASGLQYDRLLYTDVSTEHSKYGKYETVSDRSAVNTGIKLCLFAFVYPTWFYSEYIL